MKKIAVVGAGGLAREVAWVINDLNKTRPQFDFLGFLTADLSRPSKYDSRDMILGEDDWLENNNDVQALALAIGDPQRKTIVVEKLVSRFPHLEWPSLIHPSVCFDRRTARFERGTIIFAGTTASVNVVLEEFSLVNLHCTLGHESRLEKFAVLGPSVNVTGGVVVGEGAVVGSGAQILPYVTVGAHATVGAGSVVVRDVEPGTTVFGVPATK
ncbi:MAG: hypothetical protein WAM65_02915, partial [Candidatus Korobacteraceae bacterium]